eukprot:CAMPEP_0184487840 /NCGR_PEP_ID=MMETSP0113_2-20130426/10363_1 /TAXON_ID=91329 /ORGANISM="Norrisiella sphaerica, Strain BC52" /LENGTH=225 /DNA_ID=CAMNT_0026870251 /DNA_START=156 /DNA_END=833 /DNA_ORIENTATION=+
MGTEKDYLIAKSLKTGKMDLKKTFYVSVDDGVSFSALLPCNEEKAKQAAALKFEMFTGNPQKKYGKAPEGEEDEEKKVPDLRLTEEERLSWVVSSIDHETCLVPKASYVLTATSRIAKNPEFSGLTSEGSKHLESYALMRKPEDQKVVTKNKCRGPSNTTDFLDLISAAKPKGCWVIQSDDTGRLVTLRNLKWEGYEFHTVVGEPDFEGAYFGDGLANEDMSLMV